MICEFCGKKEAVGYIDGNEACEDCIDRHNEELELHPITRRFLRKTDDKND